MKTTNTLVALVVTLFITGCASATYQHVDPAAQTTLAPMPGVGDVKSKQRTTVFSNTPSGASTNITLVELWQTPEAAQKDLKSQELANKIPAQTQVGAGIGILGGLSAPSAVVVPSAPSGGYYYTTGGGYYGSGYGGGGHYVGSAYSPYKGVIETHYGGDCPPRGRRW